MTRRNCGTCSAFPVRSRCDRPAQAILVQDVTESEKYKVQVSAAAARSLTAIPPRITESLIAFIFGSLAENPRRRGKPLQRELAGTWAARRGDFRVLYRLDEDTETLTVLLVDHRADVYRSR